MPKCKKCTSEFEVPKNAIELAFAVYCKDCIKKGLKKMAKMPLDEYMQITAKQSGLGDGQVDIEEE